MATKVLSFVNFKGGVGKTAIAVNLAATIATHPDLEFRRKVLLIDVDAQASASIWLMGDTEWKKSIGSSIRNTVFQIFQNSKYPGPSSFDFHGTIVNDDLLGGNVDNLDLLPSSYKMAYAEEIILQLTGVSKNKILKEELEPHIRDNEYGLVIFDCPPNTYRVTQNALAMSDYIFVPAIPDYLSVVGFRELVDRLTKLAPILGLPLPVPVRGVIVNAYREDWPECNAGVDQLQEAIDELFNKKALDNKCSMLEPYLARTNAVSIAAREMKPFYAMRSSGAKTLTTQYRDLAKNILSII